MGFQLGVALGAAANSGINTYEKLTAVKAQQLANQKAADDQAKEKAYDENIKSLPRVGDPVSDGSAPAALSNAAPAPSAVPMPGQQGALGAALTPTPDASVNPNAPAGIAAPVPSAIPAGQPQAAAPPPRTYTADDIAQMREDHALNSGLPSLMQFGSQMRNNRLQGQLIKQQVASGDIDLASKQYGQQVSQALQQYQTDPDKGMQMLSAAYNHGLPNGGHVNLVPAHGEDEGKVIAVHYDSSGRVIGKDAPATPMELFAQADGLRDPAKYQEMLLKKAQIEGEAAKGRYYDAESNKIGAVIRAGGPDAEVQKLKAESVANYASAHASDTNSAANAAYKQAMDLDIKAKTDYQNKKMAMNQQLQDPKIPSDQKRMIANQIETLEGRAVNEKITPLTDGTVLKHDPYSVEQDQVFSKDLNDYVPMGYDGAKIAKDPLVKSGKIVPGWTPDGRYGFTVPGVTGQGQMFSKQQEAIDAYKAMKNPKKKQALPKDNPGTAAGETMSGGGTGRNPKPRVAIPQTGGATGTY